MRKRRERRLPGGFVASAVGALAAAALILAPATVADTSHAARTTADLFGTNLDYGPSWSPDGGRIAFTRRRFGDDEVFVVNADGSGLRDVSRDRLSQDQGPDWSPDGRRLAFATNLLYARSVLGEEGHSFIVVAAPDGTKRRPLPTIDVGDGEDPPGAFDPSWAPDGRLIAMVLNHYSLDAHGYASGIYIESVDGREHYQLADLGLDPDWSPDGSKILFRLNGIYVMTSTGADVRPLVPPEAHAPAWSPDGTRIAFASTRDGNTDVYVVDADGTNERRLTVGPRIDGFPAWSPDGEKLAYFSGGALFVMNADGSRATPLTRSAPARCTIRGTPRADVLKGTQGADVICGLDGNDTILGRGGDDVIDGGAGADRIDGGAGSDVLYGGGGSDRLVGGPGGDLLLGGAGADLLDARDGGRDVLDGGAGNDGARVDDGDDTSQETESVRPG